MRMTALEQADAYDQRASSLRRQADDTEAWIDGALAELKCAAADLFGEAGAERFAAREDGVRDNIRSSANSMRVYASWFSAEADELRAK